MKTTVQHGHKTMIQKSAYLSRIILMVQLSVIMVSVADVTGKLFYR